MTVLDFAGIMFSGIAGVVAFSYYAAHIAEEGTSEEAKRRVVDGLKSLRLTPRFRSAFETFQVASDNYFGPRLISLKAFFRSLLLSLSWVVFLLLLCSLIFPDYQTWLRGPIAPLVAGATLWMFCAGMLIDYLSVCLTRSLIRFSLKHGRLLIASVAIIDLLASALLFYLLFSAVRYLAVGTFLSPEVALSTWLNVAALPGDIVARSEVIVLRMPEGTGAFISPVTGELVDTETELVYSFPGGILFISSLLTSVWMWLFVGSYWFLLGAGKVDGLKARLQPYLNIDKSPFHAIALIILVLSIVVAVTATTAFAILG